jgi:hypothetical protein
MEDTSRSRFDDSGTRTLGESGGPDAGVAVATPAVGATEAAQSAGLFEDLYRAARGDMGLVRWAHGKANPALVEWLGSQGPALVRPGARVAVVGCGLGDDVVELAGRGYDAMGIDVAPSAIQWAQRRFPELAERFAVADLFALPHHLQRRFDLVVEIYTIQSLDPWMREAAAAAVVSLCRPRGTILTVCRARQAAEPLENVQGPPWPLTAGELCGLFEAHGLTPAACGVEEFTDDEQPPKWRLRAAFRRGG